MSFKEALAKARAGRPEPELVEVAVGDDLFQVEVSRLDGMDWAAVMADCPPSPASIQLGYDATVGAVLACERHGRLLDSSGDPVEDVDWRELFAEISGAEARAVAATWWALNMRDPNTRVVELKKALEGGARTSSS